MLFSNDLVDGDPIPEPGAGRMRGPGQEGDLVGVTSVDIGVGHSGEDGEPVADRGEDLEVRRGRILAAGILRKEEVGHDALGGLDRHEPLRGGFESGSTEQPRRGFQSRQCQQDARRPEETAS
jgi:hypothetical protein